MRLEQILSVAVTAMYLFDVTVVSMAYARAGWYVLTLTIIYCASVGEIYSIGKLGRWLNAKRHQA
jgi:hypothetical protein